MARRPPRSWIAALIAVMLMAGCSYYDPTPGTIDLHTTLHGEPHGCTAQVFNDKGSQIQSLGINDGHVHVEKLAPGTYTLKFEGYDNQMYPAVRTVTLFAAGEVKLDVELSDAVEKKPAT